MYSSSGWMLNNAAEMQPSGIKQDKPSIKPSMIYSIMLLEIFVLTQVIKIYWLINLIWLHVWFLAKFKKISVQLMSLQTYFHIKMRTIAATFLERHIPETKQKCCVICLHFHYLAHPFEVWRKHRMNICLFLLAAAANSQPHTK